MGTKREMYEELKKKVPYMINNLTPGEFGHTFDRHLNQRQEELRSMCRGDRTDKGAFYGKRDVLVTELKKILLQYVDEIADMLMYEENEVVISIYIPKDFPLYTNVYCHGKGHKWTKGPLVADALIIVVRNNSFGNYDFRIATAYPGVTGQRPLIYDE